MKLTVGQLRSIMVEALREGELDDELNTLEVGDMVDVDGPGMGIVPVRITRLVDDVEAETGIERDTSNPDDEFFEGPGFVGDIDPASGEGGELVFSLHQVMPGSKAKYYFPKLGEPDEWNDNRYGDHDEYGRRVNNPYRAMARKFANQAVSRRGDYVGPEGIQVEGAVNEDGAPGDGGRSVMRLVVGSMKGGLLALPDEVSAAMRGERDPRKLDVLRKVKGLVQHAQRDMYAAAAMLSDGKKKD